jgi:hypothetical protein
MGSPFVKAGASPDTNGLSSERVIRYIGLLTAPGFRRRGPARGVAGPEVAFGLDLALRRVDEVPDAALPRDLPPGQDGVHAPG